MERKGGSGERDKRERGTDRTEGRREPEPSQPDSGEDPKPNIFRGNYVEFGITEILINSKMFCNISLILIYSKN